MNYKSSEDYDTAVGAIQSIIDNCQRAIHKLREEQEERFPVCCEGCDNE